MSAQSIIDRCGDNAALWAKEFCRVKAEMSWTIEAINEELMVAWFANAIENACRLRESSRLAALEMRMGLLEETAKALEFEAVRLKELEKKLN